MQQWLYLALAVLVTAPLQVSAEEKQSLVILLGEACGSREYLLSSDYFVTCWKSERFHMIAKDVVDPSLYDYFYVVFVTADKQSEHLGYSIIDESWGWCQPWKACIKHELLHLTEGTTCTSDGAHDKDLVYVNGKYVTCAEARA